MKISKLNMYRITPMKTKPYKDLLDMRIPVIFVKTIMNLLIIKYLH